MLLRIYLLFGIICVMIGALCFANPSASFGILFFLSLGIGLIGLSFCMKMSRLKIKHTKVFKCISNIGQCLLVIWLISFVCIQILIYQGSFSDEDIVFDVLIVLGAGVAGNVPSISLQSRLDTAIWYLNENPDTIVITTGGLIEGQVISDAFVARNYLVENGIDSDRVLYEEISTNTFENIQYARALLPEDYSGTVAVVSNNFHLFRGRLLLDIHGLSSYAIGSSISTYTNLNILYSIREYFSVVKHFLFER